MIATARLALEPARPEHAEAMFAGLSNLMAYEFIPDEPPACVAVLAARYAGWATGKSPDGRELWLNWMIRRQEATDYMGYVQATILPEEAAVLIAYHVFPAFWGGGYGREAVSAMLAACRRDYRLREARAYIDTRNTRSLRLVAALGFRRMAVIPGADFFRGQVSDEYFCRLKFAA
jgi:[ribosomal protein S5]-alanine N-acetyltransferase